MSGVGQESVRDNLHRFADALRHSGNCCSKQALRDDLKRHCHHVFMHISRLAVTPVVEQLPGRTRNHWRVRQNVFAAKGRLDEGSCGDWPCLHPRPSRARRPCWPTGPAAASGRRPGCLWTLSSTFEVFDSVVAGIPLIVAFRARQRGSDVPTRVPKGWVQKKCHETETQLGVATRETTEDPQVREDQYVTWNETLHRRVCRASGSVAKSH